MSGKPALTRRDFLKWLKAAAVEIPILGAASWIYGHEIEPLQVETKRVTLTLNGLAPEFSGFRLVQISDLHAGGWMNAERFARVLPAILAESPQLVAITGDFVLGHSFNLEILDALAGLSDPLRRLAGQVPTFAVLGNHDHWAGANAVREMLVGCGVIELENAVHSLERGGAQLHLAGVDDVWERHDRLDRVLSALPGTGCAILLAHEPDFADVAAQTGRFGLQLSGHTHGGQVVIPAYGPPILPYLGMRYPAGLYEVNGMFQYTNRGLGMTGIQVRFNCRPEITVFTLNSSDPTEDVPQPSID